MEKPQKHKEGSLWRVCLNRILERQKHDAEAIFSDAEIAEWLDEEIGSDALKFAWLNIHGILKRQHDIWLIRVKSSGYKIANDQERIDVIYEQKTRKILNAMTDGIAVLAGVNRSALETGKQSELDSKQQKSAFHLQAFMQIQRARNLEASISLQIAQPDNPKLFLTADQCDSEDKGGSNG